MTSIFVAKLDYGISQEELKSEFEKFGRVNKVTIATDRETGKPRGFAFVEMFDESEAEKAIQELDGYTMNGREIAVKKAEDRGQNKPQSSTQNKKPFQREEKSSHSAEVNIDPIPPVFSTESIKLEARKKVAPPKKSKEKMKDLNDGKPRQHKMPAYKKSGKNNRFFDVDDDDYDY